jgi:hypothetical protein
VTDVSEDDVVGSVEVPVGAEIALRKRPKSRVN